MAERVEYSGQPQHPTCVEVTGPAGLSGSYREFVHGPDCPRPAGPDPERDARVRARRAADSARARKALDELLGIRGAGLLVQQSYDSGFAAGYRECQSHHNRDYGAPR